MIARLVVKDERGEQGFGPGEVVRLGGAEDCEIRVGGDPEDPIAGNVELHEGRALLELVVAASGQLNGRPLAGIHTLSGGDEIEVGEASVLCERRGDRLILVVSHSGRTAARPPLPADPSTTRIEPHPYRRRGPEQRDAEPAAPRPSVAAEAPDGRPRPPRFTLRQLTIGVALSVVLLFVGLVSLVAVPVRVSVEPPPDELSFSESLLQLRFGERILLREGRHLLRAHLEGYAPLEAEYVVADEPSQEFVFRLSPLPGRVEVRTRPVSGVGLLVDGERRETSPVDLELAAGPHRIELDGGPRFQAASVDFEVEGLGANQELLLTLTPAWAEVSVRSKPPGAEVVVDGEPAGVTPTVLELLAGEHRLELHHPDFKSVAQRVTVEANTPLELPEVVLGAAPGRAAIESRPAGATVTVDGGYRGKTPIQVTLDPGDHRVQLHKPGHRRASRSVRVASKETSRLSVPLEPIRGLVEVRVEPADAVVSVDGRELGRGSQTLELLATSHVIEVSKPGYGTERVTVTAREDLRGLVEITLHTLAAIREASRPKAIDTSAGQIVLVRPGRFQMGASRRERDRRANEVLHDVELTRPFYIGTREVTNAEFRVFAPGHRSGSPLSSLDADELPVVGVSWADAARFCNWLSDRDGLPPTYVEQGGTLAAAQPLTTGYRLPLEAEWAWVARYGGGERAEAPRYPWGDAFPPPSGAGNYADLSAQGTLTNLMPSYRDGFPTTAPSAQAAVGPRGLRGLGGNVSEWMHDRYGISRTAAVRDPTGSGSGGTHVIRGGSWRDWSPAELRLTFRDHGSDGQDDVGFRIARYAD